MQWSESSSQTPEMGCRRDGEKEEEEGLTEMRHSYGYLHEPEEWSAMHGAWRSSVPAWAAT